MNDRIDSECYPTLHCWIDDWVSRSILEFVAYDHFVANLLDNISELCVVIVAHAAVGTGSLALPDNHVKYFRTQDYYLQAVLEKFEGIRLLDDPST